MKKVIITIIVILVVLSALVYFDYFYVKTNNTSPKISIKEEVNENQILYKAIFYKVWYCKTNKSYTIASYDEVDAVCPSNYAYVDGYYTNSEGIKISKRDLQLLVNNGIYTGDMVETINSNTMLESFVHVAYNYGKAKYKITSKKSSDGHKLVMLSEFKEDDDVYKWIYDEEKLYCLKDNNSIALYDSKEEKCGKYEKIKMDSEWCSNYKTSTLVYEDNISSYCEE